VTDIKEASEKNRIFVGVAWPYANGSLHAGHIAGAYLPADIFARFARMSGHDVLFVSGSDSHGTPITLRADELGQNPHAVATRYHDEFGENWRDLGISFDIYTTTMTENHRQVVQDQFLVLLKKGLLVERNVDALYDETIGRFLPDRYVVGRCVHCGFDGTRGDQCENCGRPLEAGDLLNPRSKLTGSPIVTRPTRHFFLDLPKLQEPLRQWVESHQHWRRHVLGETRKFLDEGLQPRAITRNLDWGVPIPVAGYEDRRIYVWFEAVTGYLSASMEWALRRGEPDAWRAWWHDSEARQYYFLGKDNIPFHTLIWPALLMGRGDVVQLPYDVPANCFLNFSGKKASKSEGVGFLLNDLLLEYEADAIRFYIAANMPELTDSNFDIDDLVTRVNGELIGTWGNLVSRTLALVERKLDGIAPNVAIGDDVRRECASALSEYQEALWHVEFRRALRRALELAQYANSYINASSPWESSRSQDDIEVTLGNALYLINTLKSMFAPFVPFSMAELHVRLGYTDHVEAHGFALEPIAPGRRLRRGEALYRKLDGC
jgi:methionyl-tRNA synthetase